MDVAEFLLMEKNKFMFQCFMSITWIPNDMPFLPAPCHYTNKKIEVSGNDSLHSTSLQMQS